MTKIEQEKKLVVQKIASHRQILALEMEVAKTRLHPANLALAAMKSKDKKFGRLAGAFGNSSRSDFFGILVQIALIILPTALSAIISKHRKKEKQN